MNVSVSQGRTPTWCPVCAQNRPQDDPPEGVAQVGGESNERGSWAILEALELPCGHTLADLTMEQEHDIIESAVEYLADARDAMRDAADDARFDLWRYEWGDDR